MEKLYKLFSDNIDKFMMTLVFFIILICYLHWMTDVLAGLVRDSFLVLTALLGFRRQPQPTGQTGTGDINLITAPANDGDADKGTEKP